MQTRRLPILLASAVITSVLVAPFAAWWQSVGNPSVYFTHDLPPGQGLYAFAKLAGLLGLALFWVQAMLGLAPRVPFLRSLPAISRRTHIRLGLAAVGLIVAHVGLFVVGSSLRKKTIAWDLLLPNFDHGYYFQSITWGAFALYLLAIALFAGWRVRRGGRVWKPAHMLWFAVFAFALFHSISIGSESRNPALAYSLFFLASSLTLVSLARLVVWLRSRKNQGTTLDHDP